MRYLSLDLETTGLGDNCQILQLAAVLDDTEKPLEVSSNFNALIWDSWYSGEPYALALNHQIFETVSRSEPGGIVEHRGSRVAILEQSALIPALKKWLTIQNHTGKIVLAGKNVAGFDLRFLKKLSGWSEFPVHHRVLDPGNLFLRPDDREPPSTDECLRRAGIATTVQHDALSDAYDVCKLIRNWHCRAESTR